MKLLELRNSFLKGNFLPFKSPLFWWLHKNVTETVCISILLISRLSNSLKRKLTGSTRCPDSKIEEHCQKKIHWEPENGRIETPFFWRLPKRASQQIENSRIGKKTGTHLVFKHGNNDEHFQNSEKCYLDFEKRVRRLRVKPDGILAPIFFRCGEETQ